MIIKIILLFIFYCSFLFNQSIYHEPIDEVISGTTLDIEVLVDVNESTISKFELFYRNENQQSYFRQELVRKDLSNFISFIPSQFIQGSYIEYYIVFQSLDDIFLSIPEENPALNPIRVNIEQVVKNDINILDSDITILGPLQGDYVLEEDLLISLSYFRMENIDLESVEIWIDDVNMTSYTNISTNHLILDPPKLLPGRHIVKIYMKNNLGLSFKPIEWSFNIISEESSLFSDNIDYDGRIWNDYYDNSVDGESTSYFTSNFDFKLKTEWIDLKTKFKKSSLENDLEQAKDRNLISLKNNVIDLKFGDFYPRLDQFSLNGNRVRGMGFNINTNYFNLKYINGELLRAIQGSGYDGAIEISDYFSEYNELLDIDQNILGISRNGYTFQKDLSALRLSFGNNDKFKFGVNFLKAKDNINSVDKLISNSIVSLPEEFNIYNSDQFIDKNSNNIYDSTIDELYLDINGNSQYDSFTLFENFNSNIEFINPDTSLVVIGSIEEGDSTYFVKQIVWDLQLLYNSNDSIFIETISNNFPNMIDSVQFLDSLWNGDKPEDNIVFGTDMKLNLNNKVSIESGLSISLNNENIWNPVKTKEDFDTYADDYQDCYYARTYSNLDTELDCTANLNECSLGDYYWEECIAYEYIDGINDLIMSLIVDELGISLEAIPNPTDFSDIFHYNFDAVPVIPFYSLIQQMENDEDIAISDIFNSPEVAYNIDVGLKYDIQQIKFGIKQIGASYYSAANPYLQKDSREKYFTDRFKFFNNKLFLSFKWKSIENGLLDESSKSKTENYDINFSMYPGIDLPNISIGYGLYDKRSGSESSLDSLASSSFDELGYEIPTVDTRYFTKTKNLNFSIGHTFKINNTNNNFNFTYYDSRKRDMLYDELSYDEDADTTITSYVSPRSNSSSYSLNFKTNYNLKWESNVYLSNNHFDFAQSMSEYYQIQDLSSINLGFSYFNKKIIDEFGGSLDYSSGQGTTKYNQFGLKLFAKLKIQNNFIASIYYTNKLKTIIENDLDNDYSNSSIKANLSYRF